MTVTKVLVVDDSMTMRALFTTALERSKDLIVVGAADGADEARSMIASLKPDVLTLDVEMPGKNGLEFLEEIMTSRPMPVIMLSTLTQKGADVSLRALEIGAVDCFPKPARATPDEFNKIAAKLCKLVMTAAKTNLAARQAAPTKRKTASAYQWDGSLVIIAGGMGATDPAMELLSALPANCPPTILLLAVEESIATPFAAKLASLIAPVVKLVADGVGLEQGTVYVGSNGSRHVAVDRWPAGHIRLVEREPINGCRPSVDLLLASAARVGGAHIAAVILSGAGLDGVAGLDAVVTAGGLGLAQLEATALIAETIAAAGVKTPAVKCYAPGEIATALTARRDLACAA